MHHSCLLLHQRLLLHHNWLHPPLKRRRLPSPFNGWLSLLLLNQTRLYHLWLVVELLNHLYISVLIQLLICFQVDLPVLDRLPDLTLRLPVFMHYHISVFECFFVRVFEHGEIDHGRGTPNWGLCFRAEHSQTLRCLPRTELWR